MSRIALKLFEFLKLVLRGMFFLLKVDLTLDGFF